VILPACVRAAKTATLEKFFFTKPFWQYGKR
jgi:hypothetical protein